MKGAWWSVLYRLHPDLFECSCLFSKLSVLMWILLLGPREISVILKLQFRVFSFSSLQSSLHCTVRSRQYALLRNSFLMTCKICFFIFRRYLLHKQLLVPPWSVTQFTITMSTKTANNNMTL